MLDYSEFIVDVMKYVDAKIETLNPKSVDRYRLHNRVQTQIVANVKRIAGLERSKVYKEIDIIFNSLLREEISKKMQS
ncbi:MAG: hypothetical protein IKJ74_04570 [Clostridia bacterium]|nr:hypothetical protein [Clostridia bacterium]